MRLARSATLALRHRRSPISVTALIDWLTNYGQVVLFFGQVIYWLVICVAAIWAVIVFQKYVSARVSRWEQPGAAAQGLSGAPQASAPAEQPKPSIEAFID
jgi:hypothetical protein